MSDRNFEREPQGRTEVINSGVIWLSKVVESNFPPDLVAKTEKVVDYPNYVPTDTEPPTEQLNPTDISELAKTLAKPANIEEIV